MISHNHRQPNSGQTRDKPLDYGRPALQDDEDSWLAFHASCLQALPLDRVAAMYDRLYAEEPRLRDTRAELAELDALEREIREVRYMVEHELADLPDSRRPEIRRRPL